MLSSMATRTAWCSVRLYNRKLTTLNIYHAAYLPLQVRCMSQATPDKKGSDADSGIDHTINNNLEKIRAGKFEGMIHPEKPQHFRVSQKELGVREEEPPIGTHSMPHPIWNEEELQNVTISHKKPEKIKDYIAYGGVKLLKFSFDFLSGFNRGVRNDKIWLNRIAFLETVAGVPGMVAAMVRHLHSLRRLRRDHAWIHTLLEEAENERMHLMTCLHLKQPSAFFRGAVIATQGVFVIGFSVAYLVSPSLCHRFVGYLEEEAVSTYSKLLKDMESGPMQHWNTMPAPDIAVRYWKLRPDATMKDVVLVIRADEAHHRVVNHTMGSMKSSDYNPYKPGQ